MQVEPKSIGFEEEVLQLVQLLIVPEHVRQIELHDTHWELIKNMLGSTQERHAVADVQLLQLLMQTKQINDVESG